MQSSTDDIRSAAADRSLYLSTQSEVIGRHRTKEGLYSKHTSIYMIRDFVIPPSIHSVWYEEKRFELVSIASRKNDVIVLANGSCTFSLSLSLSLCDVQTNSACTYRDFMSCTFQYITIRGSVTLVEVR